MTYSKPIAFETAPFFELTPDLVCIADRAGFFRQVNDAVIQTLGYSREELFAKPIASFIHPEDRAHTSDRRSELLQGKPLTNFQNRYMTKNGAVVWLHWTSVYMPERDVVLAIAKDVTARKELEQALEEKYKKFKSLATHFKSSLERDRKYLAVELHEELAQLASVVKMDIDWVSNHAAGLDATARTRISHALGVSDLLINAIRRISYSISPHLLEDAGLNAAMKWLCTEFSMLNGMPCYFETSFDDSRLAPEVRLDLFRICQEALSNIMYHAQSNSVQVILEGSDQNIRLTIADDGHVAGADEQGEATRLANIRERAASINGHILLESKPEQGTKLCVLVSEQTEEV